MWIPTVTVWVTLRYARFEYRVLQGAQDTIQGCRPIVVVEQKPHDAYSREYGQHAAIDLLKSWGMRRLDQVKDDWIMGW